MKIWLELNYRLEKEPEQFKEVETISTRKVYIWENNRATMTDTGIYSSHMRVANGDLEEPLLEIWSATEQPIPNIVDDSWEEQYKVIDYTKASLEWNTDHHLLRLCWDQQLASYQEGKVKAKILELLQSMNLNIPPLVKVK